MLHSPRALKWDMNCMIQFIKGYLTRPVIEQRALSEKENRAAEAQM